MLKTPSIICPDEINTLFHPLTEVVWDICVLREEHPLEGLGILEFFEDVRGLANITYRANFRVAQLLSSRRSQIYTSMLFEITYKGLYR